MEHITVLWIFRKFIVNEFGFQSLLRSNHNYGFSSSSRETTHEVVQLVLLCENVALHEGVGTEPDLILGNREHKKCSIATIEAEEPTLTIGLLDGSQHSLLVDSGVQLHDSLGVLGWVSACNLNRASDSTYKD